MKIRTITFTGADDKTQCRELRALSADCPQVEWGILLSKNNGNARYPKWSWVESLVNSTSGLNLAAHFCGQYVRDLLLGDFSRLHEGSMDAFKRIQVNFHGIPVTDVQAEAFLTALAAYDQKFEWLFQLDGVNDKLYWAAKVQGIRVFPFHDLSGGDGVLPETWPVPIGDFCGYAGGLGPHNLEQQLTKLAAIMGEEDPVWIDMETWVRDDRNMFDLERVHRCIEIAAPYF